MQIQEHHAVRIDLSGHRPTRAAVSKSLLAGAPVPGVGHLRAILERHSQRDPSTALERANRGGARAGEARVADAARQHLGLKETVGGAFTAQRSDTVVKY